MSPINSTRREHDQPCGCCFCDTLRAERYAGPSIYKAIAAAPRMGGGSATVTWTLEHFRWGERIPAGELLLVVRELKKHEAGGHLDAVLIVPLDGRDDRFTHAPHLCTSKKWIEPA